MKKKTPLHVWKTWIGFGDTDPAQRIYFARLFDIGHRCAEDFALKHKAYASWFHKAEWGTPVRHAEAEYLKPLRPGDEIEVRMFPDRLGRTSFTWRFEIYSTQDELMGFVKTTHVTINTKTGETGPVTDKVKALFAVATD